MNTPNPQPPLPGQPGEVRVPVVLRTNVKRPVVTYTLLAVTILMYGVQYLSQMLSSGGYDWPFLLGGKINEFILQGQVWRLITPVLLHANIIHLGFNMYALFSIGSSLERFYGHKRFLWLYLIAGYGRQRLVVLAFCFSLPGGFNCHFWIGCRRRGADLSQQTHFWQPGADFVDQSRPGHRGELFTRIECRLADRQLGASGRVGRRIDLCLGGRTHL